MDCVTQSSFFSHLSSSWNIDSKYMGRTGGEEALTLSQPIKESECVPQDGRRGSTNPFFSEIWPRTPYRRLNTGIEWPDKRVLCKNSAERNECVVLM
ncbi:UNVERIFIED_CONTAM: hypothetical protein NCL1_61148 [Trichonephila clavipes]